MGQVNGATQGQGPVVVWNTTRTCNLKCIHCYSNSESKKYDGELDTGEALRFIDHLAEFKVPVILFSGGEPLLREDLIELVTYAKSKGIRATISTNGTLLSREKTAVLKNLGVGYILSLIHI